MNIREEMCSLDRSAEETEGAQGKVLSAIAAVATRRGLTDRQRRLIGVMHARLAELDEGRARTRLDAEALRKRSNSTGNGRGHTVD